jgi:hypothetical protein
VRAKISILGAGLALGGLPLCLSLLVNPVIEAEFVPAAVSNKSKKK